MEILQVCEKVLQMSGLKDKVHYKKEEKQKGKTRIGVMMFFNKKIISVCGSLIRYWIEKNLFL